MTVGELKALVASALGVSPSDLSLSSGSTPLSSDTATLGASGVPNGGSIGAVHSGTVPPSPYTVSVSLPADMHAVYGPTLTLPASSSTTIDQLKALIESTTGVGAASLGLSFGGSDLSPGSQTLSGAGLSSGASVQMSSGGGGGSGIGGGCIGMISSGTVYSACQDGDTDGDGSDWDQEQGLDLPPLPAPATDAEISGIHLADLNADGIDDLIVLTYGGHPSYVYLNPGNGNFSAATPTPIGSDSTTNSGHSTSAAVADMDYDGVMDIVIGNDGTSNRIYLGVSAPMGDYSGVLGLPFGSSNGPTVDVEVGDIDGDGALDIAAANDGMPNVIYWGNVSLLANVSALGRRRLQADAASLAPEYAQLALDKPDPETSGVSPWPWSTIGTQADPSTSIALGDLDGDGDLDIVVGNKDGAPSRVHLNPLPTSAGVRDDLRDDPGVDLAGSAGKDTMDVALTGSSDPATDAPLDINEDGVPDVVLAVSGGPNIIYYGPTPPNVAGDFTGVAGTEIGVPSTDGTNDPSGDPIKDTQSVELVDVDGDGDTDAVFGNADGTATTYYNENGILKLVPLSLLSPSTPPPSPPAAPPDDLLGAGSSEGEALTNNSDGGPDWGLIIGLIFLFLLLLLLCCLFLFCFYWKPRETEKEIKVKRVIIRTEAVEAIPVCGRSFDTLSVRSSYVGSPPVPEPPVGLPPKTFSFGAA